MKVIGVVLVLVALAALGVFLWPLVQPDSLPLPMQEPAEVYSRGQFVAPPATQAGGGAAPSGRLEATMRTQPIGPSAAPPVEAKQDLTVAEQAAAERARAATAPPAPTGPLCDRLLPARSARPFKLPPHRALRSGPASGPSAWTWISLWAAWCKPCKEEMPLLVQWAEQQQQSGRQVQLLFLSVDDDERELRRFLEGEGRSIRGEFKWLVEEGARSTLYTALEIKNPPTLPVQALLDPEGRLRCVRVGSITEADLATVPQVMGW